MSISVHRISGRKEISKQIYKWWIGSFWWLYIISVVFKAIHHLIQIVSVTPVLSTYKSGVAYHNLQHYIGYRQILYASSVVSVSKHLS